MTLYLCIAAYLAVAVLIYGIVCGLEWSEFGYWSGWGRRDTLWCMTYALLLPIGIGHVIMRGCSVWRGGLDRMPFRPRWYFRSRRPARESRKSSAEAEQGRRERMEESSLMLKKQLQEMSDLSKRLDREAQERRRQEFREVGPQNGTVAHKMRRLSEDAERLRADREAALAPRLKLDALNLAVDKISHMAKEGGYCFELDGCDPWVADGGKDWVAIFPPGPGICVLLRTEVLPFLADSLREMGFRVEEVMGIGELYGITHIRVEW